MMKKKKRIGYVFVILCLAVLIIGIVCVRMFAPVIGRPPSVWTQPISLAHNRYGDYLVGYMAGQNRDYDVMTRSFERALQADPENEKLKTSVYLLKAVRGEVEEVLPLAIDLSRLKKPELLTDYVLMTQRLRSGDYIGAGQILNHKPSYGPDRILKPALTLWLQAGQGNRLLAEKALKKLDTPASRGTYLYYRALSAWYFGDTTAADKSFQEMIRLKADTFPSLTTPIFMAAFYQSRNQWQAGFLPYDRVQAFLKRNPSVADVLRGIDRIPSLTPAVGAAIAFYDVSVALAPFKAEESSLILNALSLALVPTAYIPRIWSGELLEQSGNYRAANRMYDKLPRITDVIRLKQVMNLISLEEYQPAKEILKELIARNPADGYLSLLMGQVLIQNGQSAKAVSFLQSADRIFRNSGRITDRIQALLSLATAYEQTGESDRVEEILTEVLKIAPNDVLALNYLGYVWLERGKNVDRAFEMVRQASDLSPNDPNIMDSLALGYFIKKDYRAALPLAEKAADLLPYSSVAQAHLGDIYQALGRRREALYQYKKALDLTTDITPALEKNLKEKLGLSR